jgi:hypothetical protein
MDDQVKVLKPRAAAPTSIDEGAGFRAFRITGGRFGPGDDPPTQRNLACSRRM